MVISIKNYQSKKKYIFLFKRFHFLIKQWPQWYLHNQFPVFSMVAYFPVEYYSPFTFVLKINTFSGRTPKKNSIERKKLFWISPFHAGRCIVHIVKTLTSMFKQLLIWASSSSTITRLKSRAYYIIGHYDWFQFQNKHFSGKWIISAIHFDRKLYHCRYFATSYLSKSKFW